MSGVPLIQTHTHKDLVNSLVINHVVEIIFAKSLWVWVWASVTPLK